MILYMRGKLTVLIALFSLQVLVAQTDTSSISKTESYFKINYDNDFFSATDRYYTQGTYFDLIVPFLRKSPTAKILVKLSKANRNYYGIRIRQDCFTPRSIRHDSIYFGERPFGAAIYFSNYSISLSTEKKQRLTTGFDIGVIGPAGKAEETQKNIHKWLKNIQPLGWEYQLKQDFLLNYYLQYEKGLFARKKMEVIATAGARAGTVYDDANAGILVRTGLMPSYFEHLGLQYTAKTDKNKFQCYVFGKGDVKAVVYNAMLQGGMFNKTSVYVLPSKDISRVVYAATGGIVVAYKRFSLEYTKVYISKEFKGGLSHGWGHCAITIAF